MSRKGKNINRKLSPLVGESGGEAVERGKCEQIQKNRNRVSKILKMILTCVRKLAPIASQARHFPPSSGEADTKEERNYSFKMYYLIVVLKRKVYKTQAVPACRGKCQRR